MRTHPGDDTARVRVAFRLLTSRQPDETATGVLVELLSTSRTRFRSSPQEADALRHGNGEAPVDESLDAAEVAATTVLARALLAYDECVMKP